MVEFKTLFFANKVELSGFIIRGEDIFISVFEQKMIFFQFVLQESIHLVSGQCPLLQTSQS